VGIWEFHNALYTLKSILRVKMIQKFGHTKKSESSRVPYLINKTKKTYTNQSCIRTCHGMSDWFNRKCGVQQDTALSPLPLNTNMKVTGE
jgi:hypothetical protein